MRAVTERDQSVARRLARGVPKGILGNRENSNDSQLQGLVTVHSKKKVLPLRLRKSTSVLAEGIVGGSLGGPGVGIKKHRGGSQANKVDSIKKICQTAQDS